MMASRNTSPRSWASCLQLGHLVPLGAQGLLAEHMLVALQKELALLKVQGVGAGDVHRVYLGRGGHLLQIRKPTGAPRASGRRPGRAPLCGNRQLSASTGRCPWPRGCTRPRSTRSPMVPNLSIGVKTLSIRLFHVVDGGLDDVLYFLHVLQHHVLGLAVGVGAAGADVGAGEAHKGEPGAVGCRPAQARSGAPRRFPSWPAPCFPQSPCGAQSSPACCSSCPSGSRPKAGWGTWR